MAKITILLPNPTGYIDYINQILLDAFEINIPTNSELDPTTTIAKKLVKKDGYILLTEEKEE